MKPMLRDLIQQLEIIHPQDAELFQKLIQSEIEVITESRNSVYHFKPKIDEESFIVKLIDKSVVNPLGNVECMLYKIISNEELSIPKCFLAGSIEINSKPFDYLILEYVEGRTLLDVLNSDSIPDEILSKLMRDCVEICGKLKNIPVEGFGPLENCNSLKGKFETYPEFISHTIKEQETLLNTMEQSRRNLLEEAWQQLERFFTENSNQISAKSSLTLVDANPANFIISTQFQKIVVIDLEVFVGQK